MAAALGWAGPDMLDLSASLNPLAGDVALRLVRRHVGAVASYPDPGPSTESLAQAIGVDPERLLLTNGGAEAIALLAAEIGGQAEAADFGLYPRQGRGPLWKSNPNNPTGRLAGADESADVWDEAFYPLATGRWTRGDATATVVGSLTKLFACPGLRLGYLLGEPDLVDRVRRRQPEWSVNGLAVAVLPDLLESADLPGWAAGVAELRARLTEVLDAHGLDPQPASANYVLCRRAQGLREALAPQGVVVRDCRSFGLVGQARVAVPSEEGLLRLQAALERVWPAP